MELLASVSLTVQMERDRREGEKHWPQGYQQVCGGPEIVASLTKLHHPISCAAC